MKSELHCERRELFPDARCVLRRRNCGSACSPLASLEKFDIVRQTRTRAIDNRADNPTRHRWVRLGCVVELTGVLVSTMSNFRGEAARKQACHNFADENASASGKELAALRNEVSDFIRRSLTEATIRAIQKQFE